MNHDLSMFNQRFIGFDRILNEISRLSSASTTTFPPYNIIRLKSEDSSNDDFLIELCLAGYSQDQISIVVEDNKLRITGEQEPEYEADWYVFKGISSRKFSREFTLAEDVEVKGADFVNGILKIKLTRLVPEERKPKLIKIGASK